MSEPDISRIALADQIEAEACGDMYRAALPELQLDAVEIGGATALLAPTIPVSYFNRAIGLGNGREATPTDIDAISACFTEAGVNQFWIHLGPAARPAELPDWLATRGFMPAPRFRWAKFLRTAELPAPVATPLRIRMAGPVDAGAVAHIVCTAFDMPPLLGSWLARLINRPQWEFLLACTPDDGRPVAAGAVYMSGEHAWLGIGSTLPEYRHQGAQNALLAARIQLAADAGCRVLATETGEPMNGEANPSLANIRRAGFEQVCSRLNYASPKRET